MTTMQTLVGAVPADIKIAAYDNFNKDTIY